MFGSRLVPSTLIGIALASLFYIIGGVSTLLGILPSGSNVALSLVGFVVPIGIGLHRDAKESAEEESEVTHG